MANEKLDQTISRNAPPPPEPGRGNARLYPKYSGGRFHILSLLRRHMQRIAETELPTRDDLVFIDFGCGDMPYRPIFEPYVGRYCGADLPENTRAQYHVGADNRIDLPDCYADVLLSNQVLEHVEDPVAYLRESYRVLKTDGILILSTHGYWMYHPNPQDLWRWTGDGLRKVIGEAGFAVTRFEGLMGLAATGFQILHDAFAAKVPTFARPLLAAGMQPLISFADHLNSTAEKRQDASVFIAVARKR
jgi:SAM-dependent methyltransferase